MDDIDNLIKKMAMTAIEKQGAGFFVKLGMAILLLLGLWYLKYRLDRKSEELARAKTELAHRDLEAHRARVQAENAESEAFAQTATKKALELEAQADQLLVEIRESEAAHVARVAKIDAIAEGDWEAINKLAGVTP